MSHNADSGARHADIPPKRRSRSRLALIISLSLIGLLVLGAAGGVWYLHHRINSNIEHIDDAFGDRDNRPTPAPSPSEREDGTTANPQDAVNILFVGSDSRISAGDPSQWEYGAQRTDAILLAHIPSDRSGAYVMSIPRDSWVEVPGYGENKINAAFSFGGAPLLIETVENLTGVLINHIVISDFESFAGITDALGGVELTFVRDWTDDVSGQTFTKGTHRLNGDEALAYARERYALPGGDFDRVKRQQNWMRSMMREVFTQDILTSPTKLLELIDTVSQSIAADEGFDAQRMQDLALSVRNLRPNDVVFLTVPVTGTGWSPDGKQSIVNLDREGFDALMDAIADDDAAAYVAANRDKLLTLGADVY